MDQLNEAFYVLARLNLMKLDEFGYREFSEASLDLAGKLIAQIPISQNCPLFFKGFRSEMIVVIMHLICDFNSLRDQVVQRGNYRICKAWTVICEVSG